MVYKPERLGLEQGIIYQETDQLVEDFSLDQGNQEMLLKNVKKISFVLVGLQFWKTATLGQGGLGEFSLEQGRKIHFNYSAGLS